MKTNTKGKVYKCNCNCRFEFPNEDFNESCLEDVRVEKQQEYNNDGEEYTHILYATKIKIKKS